MEESERKRIRSHPLFQFLVLANAKLHGATWELLPTQIKAIEFMQKKKTAQRNELAKHLELDFEAYPEGSADHNRLKTRFYNAVSPLLSLFLTTDRSGKVAYSLSYEKFRDKMNLLRKSAEYHLR